MRQRIVSVALGAVALTCASVLFLHGCGMSQPSNEAVPARRRPNIVMILADDMGYSDPGAMGGEIQTPHIDALVTSGRLMTNYRTGASCSPTRAMLMSGTDHHISGLGAMAENIGISIGQNQAPWGKHHAFRPGNMPQGYEGYLNDGVHSMPQLLRDAGYHTYMVGKWHIGFESTDPENNQGAPVRPRPASFPKAKGFERSYALLQGGASHYAPDAAKPVMADRVTYVEDDGRVSLPRNFYSSTSFTDKMLSYIEADKGDGKPFFAYLAYTAPHWPLQAPDEDIARVKGRYDVGYELIRARRVEKMKALGLVPKDFTPNPGLDAKQGHPRWADLSPEKRAMEARKMEVYAAMIENMDRNIGRLVQHLKDTGRYDNTMFVFASDNGAEGSVSIFADNEHTDNRLENIGRPRSNVIYGERWAEVSATPFRLWKGYQSEGGVSSPLIIRMPGQRRGEPYSGQLVHVSDLAPTFLDLAGVSRPDTNGKGLTIQPMTGLSMLHHLRDSQRMGPRGPDDALAGELFTSRYVIRGEWKLLALPEPAGTGHWELYNLKQDRGETHDLATTNPGIVTQLSREYDAYAQRVGVQRLPPGKRRAPAP